MATEYIFKTSDGQYVCIDASGTLGVTTTFNHTTCIWSGTSGSGKFTCNNKALGCTQDGTVYTPAAGGTQYTTITINNGYVTYNKTNYYKYNSTDGFTCTTDATDAITATAVLKNELNLSVSTSQTYIDAVDKTLTFTPTAGGTAYYLVDGIYYTLGWAQSDTKPTVTYAYSYSLSGDGKSYSSMSGNTLKYTKDAGYDISVTVTGTVYPKGYSSVTKTATKSITLQTNNMNAPVISRVRNANQNLTNLYQITTSANSTVKFSIDGTDIDASASNGTKYSSNFEITTEGTVIKARAVSNGNKAVSAQVEYTVSGVLSTPTGISGGTVTLNDLEDHTWTYYSGVNASVDGGNYNTNYKGLIYSPNPRNVKITYNGVDLTGTLGTNVAVSATESQNQFVYFETLEKNPIGFDGDYPYEVIPNPFSKRPTGTDGDGNKVYYGFAGWKIVSGGEHIQREDGTQASNNDILNLEELIHFTNMGDDDGNIIAADVVLETTWTPATVYIQSTKPTFTGGTYETNFWVVNSGINAPNPLPQNCTITSYTPDGGATAKYTSASLKGSKYVDKTSSTSVTTKVEYISTSGGSFLAQGRNFYIGRGVTGGSTLYSSYQLNTDVHHVFRIESGTYSSYNGFYSGASTGAIGSNDPADVTKHVVIFGSDFDRANADNSKLKITGASTITSHSSNCSDTHKLMSRLYFKSGQFNSNDSRGASNGNSCFYFGTNCSRPLTYTKMGGRYVEIQGGIMDNICGGYDSNLPYYSQADQSKHDQLVDDDYTDRALTLRIKGGTVRGVIYGAAQTAPGHGTRVFAFTGGEVQGWIAAGANGSSSESGVLYGQSFIYAGGNFRCDTKNSGNTTEQQKVINKAIGGYIFGAGCGLNVNNKAGEVKLGTNVVVADNAYIEHGVYGGGAYGFCSTDKTATLYMTGGTLEGKAGGAINGSYTENVKGGLFGGASLNKGGNSQIYMTGGTVGGVGVYGGSNYSGTLSGNTNVKVVGGSVGSSTENANVHGGGYGNSTIVTGNVDVTVGGNAVVNGDVYGGSALGKVNGTAANTSTHTAVAITGGTITGSLYGGGLGDSSNAAYVYGPVTVNVSKGTVTNVYGCNNTNGAPQETVEVNVTGGTVTNSVYGGGNQAAYKGSPVVTMSGGTVTQNVFGGGNAATIEGSTTVIVKGPSEVNGNVYGGGNAAEVTGTTKVQIGDVCE